MAAQLALISEDRAVIEQAKGVLMAAYGITANRDRAATMPQRHHTCAQNRTARITAERNHNQPTRPAARSGPTPTASHRPSRCQASRE
jgi:ANTAR domain